MRIMRSCSDSILIALIVALLPLAYFAGADSRIDDFAGVAATTADGAALTAVRRGRIPRP